MAIGARRHFERVGELRTVDVLMTLFALGGSGLEVRIHQLRSHIRGFVAVNAGGSPMSPQERKCCLRVIKAPQIPPRLRVMASLTARACNLLHAIFELALVRIQVTGGTGAVFKVEKCCILQHTRLAFGGRCRFVAVATRSRDVSAS